MGPLTGTTPQYDDVVEFFYTAGVSVNMSSDGVEEFVLGPDEDSETPHTPVNRFLPVLFDDDAVDSYADEIRFANTETPDARLQAIHHTCPRFFAFTGYMPDDLLTDPDAIRRFKGYIKSLCDMRPIKQETVRELYIVLRCLESLDSALPEIKGVPNSRDSLIVADYLERQALLTSYHTAVFSIRFFFMKIFDGKIETRFDDEAIEALKANLDVTRAAKFSGAKLVNIFNK